ncbi:MAG: hypothetical protein M3Z84_01755 [Actinomycetota bacterium]|nr:hypothetical protein [Actinomycetota bacterium]
MTRPRVPSWYHHIPPAVGLVPCEGAQHRVAWRRGKLVLEDHDLSAENALLAFGGEPCACMQALRLWRHQFGMPPDLFSSMQKYLGADAALAPRELSLPRELGMDLSWDRAWRRSSFLERKQERLLQAALRERALPLFREHLTLEKQRHGCRVISGAQVRIAPSIAEVTVAGEMDKVAVRATVELNASWLVQIWPRGLGLVDGAFVVELVEDSYDAPLVRAVRWDGPSGARRVPLLAPARVTDGRLAWEDE